MAMTHPQASYCSLNLGYLVDRHQRRHTRIVKAPFAAASLGLQCAEFTTLRREICPPTITAILCPFRMPEQPQDGCLLVTQLEKSPPALGHSTYASQEWLPNTQLGARPFGRTPQAQTVKRSNSYFNRTTTSALPRSVVFTATVSIPKIRAISRAEAST